MKNNRLLLIILFGVFLSTSSFIYGAAVGVWKIFPYASIATIYEYFKNAYYTTVSSESSEEFKIKDSENILLNQTLTITKNDKDANFFWNQITIPNSIVLSKETVLNNFEVRWGRVDDENLAKVGAIIYQRDKIWYVNQMENKLLEQLGLSDKTTHSGGIKAIFQLKGKKFAYIAYSDAGCTSARIYDLSSEIIVLQLPCLPQNDPIDLAGVGGGWVKLNDNEILLTTGTPTMSAHVSKETNMLAQNDNSPWGKILRISISDKGLSAVIYTKGHRNPQGMAKIDGVIYAVEHGPRGGDEINIISEGSNYGWPLHSFGSEYDLTPINNDLSKIKSSTKPLFSFVPSIGISYIGNCPSSYKKYYHPNSCIAVSSMRGNSLFFVVHDGTGIMFYERMDFESRIRKFKISGDNLIAVTDYEGLIIGKFYPSK